ncbi:hypothetical protein [Flavobacterium sp.]|uniref:hypothetical protein n=1 Tax=Flavobacterium sp. TaxID=239 RepID=UPI0037523491
MPGILPFLPSIISAGTAIYDGISGNQERQDTFTINQQNRDFQKQMWNENNAYNTPLAQKKRMLEAGFNPNLVYGNGTVANTSQMGNVPSAVAPKAPKIRDIDTASYFDIQQKQAQTAVTAKQLEVMTAQINNSTKDTEYKQALIDKTGADIPKINVETDRSKNRLSVETDIASTQVSTAKENLRQTQLKNETIEIGNKTLPQRLQLQAQESISKIQLNGSVKTTNEFEAQIKSEMLKLYKAGLSPQDPIYARVLDKMYNAIPDGTFSIQGLQELSKKMDTFIRDNIYKGW